MGHLEEEVTQQSFDVLEYSESIFNFRIIKLLDQEIYRHSGGLDMRLFRGHERLVR